MMYYVTHPTHMYTYIVAGFGMIIGSLYALNKIYRGSKSLFAYILMAFTLVDGLCYCGFFVFDTFVKVEVIDGVTHHLHSIIGF